ncbi:MAG: hypothetical protein ACRC4W_02480 [Treponemataceae bacterium]
MNLVERAKLDLPNILNQDNAGSSFILKNKEGESFDLFGTCSDVGYALNEDGAPITGRSFALCYQRSLCPKATKGWIVEIDGEKFAVSHVEPDRTLDINRLILAV